MKPSLKRVGTKGHHTMSSTSISAGNVDTKRWKARASNNRYKEESSVRDQQPTDISSTASSVPSFHDSNVKDETLNGNDPSNPEEVCDYSDAEDSDDNMTDPNDRFMNHVLQGNFAYWDLATWEDCCALFERPDCADHAKSFRDSW